MPKMRQNGIEYQHRLQIKARMQCRDYHYFCNLRSNTRAVQPIYTRLQVRKRELQLLAAAWIRRSIHSARRRCRR